MDALTAYEAVDADLRSVHLSHAVAACWRPVDTCRYMGPHF